MKVWMVVEPGEAIWAVFRRKRSAERFRMREFGDHPNVVVRPLRVLAGLKAAPRGVGDTLPWEVDLAA